MGKEKRFRQSLFMRKKKPVLANTKLFRLLYDYTQIPPLHRFLSLDGRLFDRAFYTWVIYYS